jgi:hypothetical protein
MKKFISIAAFLIICISAVSAQSSDAKKDPVGKWKFDAPYAPEGYTTGTVEIGFAENKYSSNITFTNIGYSFSGEKVTVRNDSLFFMIWVDGTDVNFAIKIEETAKMTGNAIYVEGTVPFTLTKEEVQK